MSKMELEKPSFFKIKGSIVVGQFREHIPGGTVQG